MGWENEQRRRERKTLASSESNPYMKTEKKVNSPKKTKRKLRPQSAKDQKHQTVGSNKRIDLDAKTSMKSDIHDFA